MDGEAISGLQGVRRGEFTTTHWSVVLAAGDPQSPQSALALETLLEDLRVFLVGEKTDRSYAQTGADLGMTEGAVKVAVHRLRRRYLELLRQQVAQTVHTPADLEEELRNLQAVFST